MEESTKIYIDANVFVYSIVNDETLGNICRNILETININKINGFTSCLTFDEVIWAVKRIKPDEVSEAGNNILNLNLKFVDVNKNILHEALDIIKEFNLKPRDAIHAATMRVHNIKNLISEDIDFDKIPWIKRKTIKGFRI